MHQSQSDPADPILVDYYKGAYGWTIRFDLRSKAHISTVRRVFLDLSRVITHAEISQNEHYKLSGLEKIVLTRIPIAEQKERVLKHTGGRNPVFYWSVAGEGWEQCVGLMDGLARHLRPGHQYLTREDVDDALIEMAFMEGGRP